MTKRVKLTDAPYRGIQVNEKVMYLSRSRGLGFGWYVGMRYTTPVVEVFYKTNKWNWNPERQRYIRDDKLTACSRRIMLYRKNIYSMDRIQDEFQSIKTKDEMEHYVAFLNANS